MGELCFGTLAAGTQLPIGALFHSLRTSDTLQHLPRTVKGAPGGIESVGTTEVAETREGSPAVILSHDISLPAQYRLQEE